MRHLSISFAIALLLFLPVVAQQYETRLPLHGVLAIPATGLAYMGIFFHELGHMFANWIYGYPAIPSFDFQHGGGMTYSGARITALLAVIYLGFCAVGVFLYRAGSYGVLAGLGIFFLFHLATAFNTGHDIVIAYMGHGAEILIACFCILRGWAGRISPTERYLNLVFGFFTFLRNTLLPVSLFSAEGRIAYDMQKGGFCPGDLSTIAAYAGKNVETVAVFCLILLILFAILTVFIGSRLPGNPVDSRGNIM